MKSTLILACLFSASSALLIGCDGGASNQLVTVTPTQSAPTVAADFSSPTDHPLVKDKIGVYQTPFMGTVGIAPLTVMQPFLVEAAVRDLRYETAWGKPDAFAYAQITGTTTAPTIDFSQFDSFMTMLHTNRVQPLLAVGYDPLPLQPCNTVTTHCWQSPPSNYAGWQSILSQVSAHYSTNLGISGIQYEIWNEPDLSLHGTKTFFSGSQTDYRNVYTYGVAGVKAGTTNPSGIRDAMVGGPAIAYDTTYITQSGMQQQPVDFYSIHAYANYSVQITSLRSAAATNGPLYMTEYGSYTSASISGPNSTHPGAMQFFADLDVMLNDPDVPKVYWAQWIDDSEGMITYALHRKAIYNAYKIYQTMLPVDRVTTTVSATGTGLSSMAGGDAHTAGIAVWNSSSTSQPLLVQMNNLPFATGTLTQWYIDQNHASLQDNAPENLTAGGDFTSSVTGSAATWSGTVQPQSLIYIHVTDGSKSLLSPNNIGTYGGDHFYFANHSGAAYADFDPVTSIARVGMGASGTGAAVAANIYDVASKSTVLNVTVVKSGPFTVNSINSIFGVRVDYQNTAGAYDKSVLYTDRLYNPQRTLALPWGTAKAVPDLVKNYTGTSFQIDTAIDAPNDWNGSRVIITPMLEDAGTESAARIRFTLGN